MAGICHLGRVRCILFFGLRLRWKKVDDWVWWMDFCGRSNLNSGIPLTENPKPLQGFIHSKALRCVFTTRPRKSSQHDSGIVTAWGRCDYGFHFATNTKFGSLMSQPRMISGEELFFFWGGKKSLSQKMTWQKRNLEVVNEYDINYPFVLQLPETESSRNKALASSILFRIIHELLSTTIHTKSICLEGFSNSTRGWGQLWIFGWPDFKVKSWIPCVFQW